MIPIKCLPVIHSRNQTLFIGESSVQWTEQGFDLKTILASKFQFHCFMVIVHWASYFLLKSSISSTVDLHLIYKIQVVDIYKKVYLSTYLSSSSSFIILSIEVCMHLTIIKHFTQTRVKVTRVLTSVNDFQTCQHNMA